MNELELMNAIRQYRNNCEEKKSITDYLIDLPNSFEKQDLEVKRQYIRHAVESLMSLTGINEFQHSDEICDSIPQNLSRRLISLYAKTETNNRFKMSIRASVFIIAAVFLVEYFKKNELDIVDDHHVLERILYGDADYLKELYECLVKYYASYQNDKDRYIVSPKGLDLLTIPLLDLHSYYMKALVNKIVREEYDIRGVYDNKIYPVACLDRIYDIWFSTSDEVKTIIDEINDWFDETYTPDKELEPIINYVISFLLGHKKLPTSEELETFISGLSEWHSFQVKIVPFYPSKNLEINTCSIPCAVDMVSRKEASLLLDTQEKMSEDLNDYQNEVIRDGDEKWFLEEIRNYNQTMSNRSIAQKKELVSDNYGTDELVPIAYCFINGAYRFAIPYYVDIEPDKLKAIIKELAQPQIKKIYNEHKEIIREVEQPQIK